MSVLDLPVRPRVREDVRNPGPDAGPDLDLDLEFAAAGGRVRLLGRRCRWPFVVGRLFVDPVAGESAAGGPARGPRAGCLVVQQAGGGTHPGDVRRQRVVVGEGVRPRVLGQGAVLVHGVAGRGPAAESTTLRVRRGGGLLHRPGVRILLPRARLEQDVTVLLEPGATAVTVDATVLHPSCLDRGAPAPVLGSLLEVATAPDAEPVVVERTHLDGVPASLHRWPAFSVVHVLAPGRATGWAEGFPHPGDVSTGAPAVAAVSGLPGGAGVAVRICARDGSALRGAVDAAVAWAEEVLLP
ncbi:urease accessory protein UreD [Kineococcus rubinsiae]|uniref:urease accessory protein UreD n=1 Tax=Kineococcus rubinsiae TaxID=2609562 RepID=UPI0014320287|nr:urease accessory protein UreD [Kineococcus rubinsiae]